MTAGVEAPPDQTIKAERRLVWSFWAPGPGLPRWLDLASGGGSGATARAPGEPLRRRRSSPQGWLRAPPWDSGAGPWGQSASPPGLRLEQILDLLPVFSTQIDDLISRPLLFRPWPIGSHRVSLAVALPVASPFACSDGTPILGTPGTGPGCCPHATAGLRVPTQRWRRNRCSSRLVSRSRLSRP
jgi:hypothetical protein